MTVSTNFDYYSVRFKLIRPFLGTCPDVSIYHQHVIEKAKKNIKEANKLTGKISKNLAKYRGVEISEDKEYRDLVGILRTYMGLVGRTVEIPPTVEGVLELSKELDEELQEMIRNNESRKATVFMRNSQGMPIISTHMILGNIKEIVKILINNGDKSILKYKTQADECLSLDIKSVEQYMVPSNDILRDAEGARVLLERPIRFEQMGKTVTAIAISEQLPEGTTFGCTLRIRKTSVFNNMEILEKVFDFGKNEGFGAWRGSGNMGAYRFKIEKIDDFEEDDEDGWK